MKPLKVRVTATRDGQHHHQSPQGERKSSNDLTYTKFPDLVPLKVGHKLSKDDQRIPSVERLAQKYLKGGPYPAKSDDIKEENEDEAPAEAQPEVLEEDEALEEEQQEEQVDESDDVQIPSQDVVENELSLKSIIQDQLKWASELEQEKQRLSKCQDFNIHDIFNFFSQRQERVSYKQFKTQLGVINFEFDKADLYLLFKSFEVGIRSLTYVEIEQLFLSNDYTKCRSDVLVRKSNYPKDINQPFSESTWKQVKSCLQANLTFQRQLESQRKVLY